ncbi:MAG: hypothetical protein GY696_22860, partial [Gammaproteobacteria bacterium]|nr:hypothetical protein [Gammaproteobacteria bacterium]
MDGTDFKSVEENDPYPGDAVGGHSVGMKNPSLTSPDENSNDHSKEQGNYSIMDEVGVYQALQELNLGSKPDFEPTQPCSLQVDSSISHDKRAPDMTFCSMEHSDYSHLDSRSMTQTFDASPMKSDISDDSISVDLHIVREIPSGVQSGTMVPPSSCSTQFIASCDVASQADRSHFDKDPLIPFETFVDLTPSDLPMDQSRTWINWPTFDLDAEVMERSLFSLSRLGEEFFLMDRGSIFSLSRRTGEEFLWRGFISPSMFDLPLDISFDVPAPFSSSFGNYSVSVDT